MKCFVACSALLLATAGQLQAGTIYTDQTAFNAAISGLNTLWFEDFEGFGVGPVADPLSIAGGAAEVTDSNSPPEVIELNGNKVWLQPSGSESNATIQGLGASPLGVSALSFEFAIEVDGIWRFETTLGTDNSVDFFPPLIPGFEFPRDVTDLVFLGWVGDPGETLSYAQYSATDGVILDDIAAYGAVPEPASLAIFGFGALGLVAGGIRRRKRQAS